MSSPYSINPYAREIQTKPNLHTPGAKDDTGKNDLDLVFGDFARALEKVGEIGTAGAIKYCEHGWLDVSDGLRRYSSALLRHYLKYKKGEVLDADSGQLHLAHMAWNSMAVLELYLLKQQVESPLDAVSKETGI